MKHLKSFSESHISIFDEFKEFCEGYLIHLVDDGFELNFAKRGYINLEISKLGTFDYNDIKDYFIPFITMLNDKYVIQVLSYTYFNNKDTNYCTSRMTFDNIIDNSFEDFKGIHLLDKIEIKI